MFKFIGISKTILSILISTTVFYSPLALAGAKKGTLTIHNNAPFDLKVKVDRESEFTTIPPGQTLQKIYAKGFVKVVYEVRHETHGEFNDGFSSGSESNKLDISGAHASFDLDGLTAVDFLKKLSKNPKRIGKCLKLAKKLEESGSKDLESLGSCLQELTELSKDISSELQKILDPMYQEGGLAERIPEMSRKELIQEVNHAIPFKGVRLGPSYQQEMTFEANEEGKYKLISREKKDFHFNLSSSNSNSNSHRRSNQRTGF